MKMNFHPSMVPSHGFNRTYEGSNFGLGFNYSLTYLIPIIKK